MHVVGREFDLGDAQACRGFFLAELGSVWTSGVSNLERYGITTLRRRGRVSTWGKSTVRARFPQAG